jgi:hypothetical protein
MGWGGMGKTRRPSESGCSRGSGLGGRTSDNRPRRVVRSLDDVGRAGRQRKRALPSVGARVGELTVVGYQRGPRGGIQAVVVRCSCSEREYAAHVENILAGRTTRCGKCAQRASAETRKRFWGYASVCPDEDHRYRLLCRISSAVQRCHNPRNAAYPNYGGRGIRIHRPWRADRAGFLRYLLTLPGWDNPLFDLDRIDNDAGYAPGNLRFISSRRNKLNRPTVRELRCHIVELESRLRHCKCGA